MSRPERVFFEGVVYHVHNRLVRGERMFNEEAEALRFRDLLREVAERDELTVFAWCLMGNHYHLRVRTGTVPLQRPLRSLQQRVTRGVNSRRRVYGSLWQRRYRAKVVSEERYLDRLLVWRCPSFRRKLTVVLAPTKIGVTRPNDKEGPPSTFHGERDIPEIAKEWRRHDGSSFEQHHLLRFFCVFHNVGRDYRMAPRDGHGAGGRRRARQFFRLRVGRIPRRRLLPSLHRRSAAGAIGSDHRGSIRNRDPGGRGFPIRPSPWWALVPLPVPPRGRSGSRVPAGFRPRPSGPPGGAPASFVLRGRGRM